MTSEGNVFCEEDETKLEFDDDDPVEPIVFIPPTVSTLSINDLPIGKQSLKSYNIFSRFSGIIYTLISSCIFTCAAFTIKQLGVNLIDAFIFRFIVQTIVTFIFILYKRYPLLPGGGIQIFLQILCCATGAGGFFLYFFAISYIEISDVATLCYTRVIWTVVFGIFIYRKRPSTSILIALPLTILGVVFVTQPTFLFSSTISSIATVNNKLRFLGFGLAIMSAIASAINVLLFKQLVSTSKNIKPSVISFQYCVAVLIFLIIDQLYKKIFLHTGLSYDYITSWRYLLASIVCLLMIGTLLLTQKAIKREHPAIFTLLGSADIIFALILQNVFTTKRPNKYALLGSTLIICSVVIIGLARFYNERRLQKKIKSMDHHTIIKDFEEKI